MTRAEERALRMVEGSAREVLRTWNPAPYTLGSNVLKRLADSLDTLDRSRETPPEPASKEDS